MDVREKVSIALVGVDGNAFSLIGAWRRAAREQGWDEAAIDAVSTEAMAGDYRHLLATLTAHSDRGALFGTADESNPLADAGSWS
jgi:hypothetical protein